MATEKRVRGVYSEKVVNDERNGTAREKTCIYSGSCREEVRETGQPEKRHEYTEGVAERK